MINCPNVAGLIRIIYWFYYLSLEGISILLSKRRLNLFIRKHVRTTPPLTLDSCGSEKLSSSSRLLGHGFLECVGEMLSSMSCLLLEIMNTSGQVDAGWDLTFPRVRGDRGVRHARACKTIMHTLANTARQRRESFLSMQKHLLPFFALDMKYSNHII